MLGRRNRFHGHGAVRRVYRLGRSARTGLFSVHTLSGEKVRSHKVAVVVSRKVSKSAVVRNRIRRRVYEQMRGRLPEIHAPTEIVLTVYQPSVAEMSPQELGRSVEEIMKKAGL